MWGMKQIPAALAQKSNYHHVLKLGKNNKHDETEEEKRTRANTFLNNFLSWISWGRQR
ncbi:MAG: hypothetical protein PHC35_08790 [Deltaproteobacteria bacterium]|nr:hypothetical protein [Deltaproteobacteria bacterium]